MITNKIRDYKLVEDFKYFLEDILVDELEKYNQAEDSLFENIYEVEDLQSYIYQAINEVLENERQVIKDDLLADYKDIDAINKIVEGSIKLIKDDLLSYQKEVLKDVIKSCLLHDKLGELDYKIDSRFYNQIISRLNPAIDNLDLSIKDISDLDNILISLRSNMVELQEKHFIVKDLENTFKANNLFDIKAMRLSDDGRTIEVINTYTTQSVNVACDSPQAMIKDLIKSLKYA